MEDVLVPLIVFGSITLMVVAGFYFSHRKRLVAYEAVRVAIEKTGSADTALIQAIVQDRIGPNADIRKGIILIAVAIAFVVFGRVLGEPEAVGPMLGIAAFPGLVGAAYVVLHFFAKREPVV